MANGNNNGVPKTGRLIFGIFMVLFYIGIGLLFILSNQILLIDRTVSIVVGALLMAYGVFRGYRLYIGSN